MSPHETLTAVVCRIAGIAAAMLVVYAATAAPASGRLLTSPATAVAVMLLLCLALAVLSAIDIETQLLPDAITLPLIAVGLVLSAKQGNAALAANSIAAAAALLLLWGVAELYRRWRGRDGLGLGDAKLFAAAGAWLGPAALPTVLAYAAIAGVIATLISGLRGGQVGLATRIPFGPYLAFAIWLVWLYGPIGVALE